MDRAALSRTVRHLALFQVDSVNVFARAHEMPLFTRCGSYDPALLVDASTGRRPLLHETWAHVASLVDITLEPALRHRQASAVQEAWGEMLRISQERPDLVDEVVAQLARRPATARQVSAGERGMHPESWGWNWSQTKTALEWAWRSGRVAVAGRTASFEKVYALPERVLPPTVDGQAGWWMRAGATVPRRIGAATLVSPFDPLIFHRPRALRLFDLDYRIEIYVPEHKRIFGYYSLPFLLGQDFVARVDLRARRQIGELEVAAVWREPGAERSPDFPGWSAVARALADHLSVAASWRRLDRIRVAGVGDLAGQLAVALG